MSKKFAAHFPPHVRIMRDRRALKVADQVQIRAPADALPLLEHLRNEEVEVLIGLWLNPRSRVIAYTEITRGLADSAPVHPREVFRHAIAAGASGIILAHNHPSGDSAPTAEDRSVTRQMVAAGQLLDIPVYDHIIIAGDSFMSFANDGLM